MSQFLHWVVQKIEEHLPTLWLEVALEKFTLKQSPRMHEWDAIAHYAVESIFVANSFWGFTCQNRCRKFQRLKRIVEVFLLLFGIVLLMAMGRAPWQGKKCDASQVNEVLVAPSLVWLGDSRNRSYAEHVIFVVATPCWRGPTLSSK